jgi:hypothetical protein
LTPVEGPERSGNFLRILNLLNSETNTVTTLQESIANNEKLLDGVNATIEAGERELREAGVDRDAAAFLDSSVVPSEVREMVRSEHEAFLAGLDSQVKSAHKPSKPKRPTMKRMV